MLCCLYSQMDACFAVLTRKRLPHRVRKGTDQFNPLEDTIKVMTMHASKAWEFPVVAVLGGKMKICHRMTC